MKKKLALYSLFLLIGVLVLSSLSLAAPKSNIGFFDMLKLQNDLPEFQSLKQMAKDKNTEIELYRGQIHAKIQSSLYEFENRINQEKKGKTTEEQAKLDKKLQEELEKKNEEFNELMKNKKAEIEDQMMKQTDITFERIRKLIEDVANEKKLIAVYEKNTIWYGGTDITQDIIEKSKKEADASVKKEQAPKK